MITTLSDNLMALEGKISKLKKEQISMVKKNFHIDSLNNIFFKRMHIRTSQMKMSC